MSIESAIKDIQELQESREEERSWKNIVKRLEDAAVLLSGVHEVEESLSGLQEIEENLSVILTMARANAYQETQGSE